jgi:methylenetetrahydrofolate dehydrogenase (NADP+)/methenyltetrahydrofolate cyclohydrolase
MAQLMTGAPVAAALQEETAARAAALPVTPALAIVRVGARPDDLAYERGATKRCEAAGITVRVFALDAACSQTEIDAAIDHVNSDPSIHACLLMRPLPAHLDEDEVCARLDPAKDVDGVGQGSLYGVFANRPVGFAPCTAEACLALLDFYGHDVAGKTVAVVGRSLVIGKPVAMLALARNATITVAHSKTPDLPAVCRHADVVVACAGSAGLIGPDCVAEKTILVDVGMNWDEKDGRLVGDAAFDAVEPVVAAVTPVPRGVGAVTTAVLASHVVSACERQVR